MVLVVERCGREAAGLVATIGQIEVSPGAANMVPGQAAFTVDVRSAVDGTRRRGVREIEREFRAIARRRELTLKLTETYNENTATCDQRFMRQLTASAERIGASSCGLPSGAGHDGIVMARICPISLLFVRRMGGSSRQPDVSVKPDDIEIATRVLLDFLQHASPNGRNLA
jgi:allantoate deiminase